MGGRAKNVENPSKPALPRREGRLPGQRVGLESGPRSGHARSVENTSALSARRDTFLDERGTGLRDTWHPERDLVVLSVWQDDSCVGTFRMSVQDIPRLSGLLAAALGDWVDQAGATPGPGGLGPVGGPRSGAPGFAGGPGSGAPGFAGGPGSGVPGFLGGPGPGASRITGEWELGGPGTVGGGLGVRGEDPEASGSLEAGLSVQQRIRLSRPVLKLRGMQHRRRRSR